MTRMPPMGKDGQSLLPVPPPPTHHIGDYGKGEGAGNGKIRAALRTTAGCTPAHHSAHTQKKAAGAGGA